MIIQEPHMEGCSRPWPQAIRALTWVRDAALPREPGLASGDAHVAGDGGLGSARNAELVALGLAREQPVECLIHPFASSRP